MRWTGFVGQRANGEREDYEGEGLQIYVFFFVWELEILIQE